MDQPTDIAFHRDAEWRMHLKSQMVGSEEDERGSSICLRDREATREAKWNRFHVAKRWLSLKLDKMPPNL